MYDFALDIINTENSPLVNSISYGWPEVASCSSVVEGHCKEHDIPNAEQYVLRSEVEFAKIAALGKTVVASSGDTGSPGPTNDDCTMTNHMLNPLYPTASAFITSVGATTLVPGKTRGIFADPPICSGQCQCSTDTKEIPCTLETAGFTTGGGFSDYVSQPPYQASAVAAYVATGSSVIKPAQQYWNASHRGFPDVAAIGNAVPIIADGSMELVGGTSASCPIIAGMISQLNNLRLNQGKSSLGLINPLLYQIASEVPNAFNDITAGGTACTEASCCKGFGYHATTGWDPVGGLGSVNFGVIYDYVEKMKN
jgi:tripeptidyl-peptidase-1